MKTHYLLTAAISCLALLFSCSEESIDENPSSCLWPWERPSEISPGITIQWEQEQQTIDGFGVAQGHADDLYYHYKRSEIVDWLYGENGLRLNIYRGEISPFFSPEKGVYDFGFDRDIDIPFDDPLFEFRSSEENGTEWEELYIRAQHWVFREVKKIHNVEKMIFSSWTPPAYMKTNNATSVGFLRPLKYKDYANYLVDFIKEFQVNGYPIYAISPANEPEFGTRDWNSCLWLPGSTTLGPFVVNDLGPAIQNAGLNTKIIFGENAQWSPILGFVLGATGYTENIINLNPRITKYDVIAAGHGYVDPITKKKLPIIPFDKALKKGIPVWLTEVSYVQLTGESHKEDIEDGLNWAADFHRYLSDANTSALIYWLGAVPGKNDEGILFMDMDNRTDYWLPKRFETFGNFSRYIKSNSQRINIERGSDLPADLHVSSFKKGNELITVIVNVTNQHVQTPLYINGKTVNNLNRILTDAENRWIETGVEATNGQYTLDIPGKSVVTFIANVD